MKKIFLFALIPILTLTAMKAHSEEERIGAGNVINITVLGYPELSQSVVVRQDGTVEYPLLANIPIFGMTQSNLSELLYPILTRYVERPRLFIYIAEYKMVQFRAQGEVKNPGVHTVQGPLDIQGALSVAGGATDAADLRNISIIRKGKDLETETPVDLYQYFDRDRLRASTPEIENGDIIIVPTRSINSYVRVMGAVNSPGTYLPMRGENIADIIFQAGGTSRTGNLNKVFHISHRENRYKSRRIKLDKLIKQGAEAQIPLALPGDIVVVREYSQWQRFDYWVSIMRDAALLASTAVILSRL